MSTHKEKMYKAILFMSSQQTPADAIWKILKFLISKDKQWHINT